ncbi:AAA family ATPase [Sulfitobacter guttiformis]|uniref:AAA domain-containing protein n=1 Tax=Sulfitobacter guttiformis TaxID=74349 RepID=A0A420DJJ5_9RHOB|nr:AAA family ATPase [Sulfitobacter guttiformis]KIN71806.1 AAA 27 domain containing protein [Sulfitobacter guttiformis KCTC 32187]RKE94378.1 AAA domain-containing protein [Sulfitobacter guttiformis]
MKLRSLTLTNVRKFAGRTATISGLGDGVSVVAQANEFGKSTFFDALHALFFLKYGAATREVKSLQPRSGGAVRVRAEIELPAGRYTVEKSYLSQKRASVHDAAGTLIALDDEAENWIGQLMGSGLEGPAGLLWVRQGITALEPAGSSKTEKDGLLGARRNLLSSVAGEIDMITGGRRMDRVIEAATQALARLATTTGQPKANGPWKEALTQAQTFEAHHAELDLACRALSQALVQRREVAARLAVLNAPGAKEAIEKDLEQAQIRFEAAQAHSQKIEQAEANASLRQLELEAAATKLNGLLTAAERLEMAQIALEQAEKIREETQEKAVVAQEAADLAQASITRTGAALAKAQVAKEAAQNHALRRSAAEKHAGLLAQVGQVNEKRIALEQLTAALETLLVTPQALARIEKAEAELLRITAERAAGGVQMHLSYEGAGRVLSGDVPLGAGGHSIDRRQVFELPGIGRMILDPGAAAADTAQIERAQRTLDSALAQVGMEDTHAARIAAAQRTETASECALLTRIIETLAPQGMAQMQSALVQAKAALDSLRTPDAETPVDPALVETVLEAAQQDEQAARRQYEVARDLRDGARTASVQATARYEAAQALFHTATAAYGDAETFAQRQSDAARRHVAAQAAALAARSVAADIRAQAPDLASAQADLTRARSVAYNNREEHNDLRTRSADLSATIRARAEDGVEEKRDEVAGLMRTANERAARFAHEAAGLTLLLETLRSKRGAAQEAYFGPVQQELAPLLALLHEDAALSFDPASMLPQGLARGGAEEQMEVLSGGTQEQIAILTRLAFARLFARQGKPMPVILDDALVYSDDNRIMAMFTALHRVAADQQVIVFSCRQMAFAGLGGARPQVQITQDV